MTQTDSDRRWTWAAAALAAAAAIVVYLCVAQVQGFGLVNYDDDWVVSAQNPAIGKGLVAGLPDLLAFWREGQFGDAWLPLYYGSLGLDHALGGGAATFHVHSVLLHALAAALTALLARKLGATAFVAGLAGVLFAVHPVATESVAWVASRKDVLSFAWMAFAALSYLTAIERGRPSLHALGAACLAVSLTAKGTTLVLPLLLAVHAILLRRDGAPLRERLRPVMPYAAVAALLTALHVSVAAREGTTGGSGATLGAILVADLEAAFLYARSLVLPVLQSVDHGVQPGAPDASRALLGGVVVVVFAGALAATWRRSPGAAAALAAVALALAPFNNVLPRTSVLFAERYAYVALLPAALAGAWLLRPRGDGPARFAPAALAVGILATLCARRLPVWADSVALWEDAADRAPRSALAQCQLADAWATRARAAAGQDTDAANARATAAWRSASALAKDDTLRVRAAAGLGKHLYVTAGSAKDAAAHLTEAAVALARAASGASESGAPGAREAQVDALVHLGQCRETLGEADAARAAYERAASLDAKASLAWNGLARLHLLAGRAAEARDALARSEAAAPSDPSVVRDRTRIRLAAGDDAGAKRDLETAIAANPRDASLLVEAARLDLQWMRPVDAETKLRRAAEIAPQDASITQALAAALLAQAQSHAARDEMGPAREAARKAAEIVPSSFEPQQVLGIVARRAGDLDAAAAHLRRARERFPDGLRIRQQLASVLVEMAANRLDEGREGLALLLLEEAVQTGAASVSTPKGRVESGTDGWPEPAKGDERLAVARTAALKGLAFLATARPDDAIAELTVAEAGARGGDPRLRRSALRLLLRARFASGALDDAVAAARELAALPIEGDADWRWRRHAELSAALAERGIARRGTKGAAGAAEDFAEARALLDAAAAEGMPAWRVAVRRGEILFAEEDFLAATKRYDEAERLAPAEADPLLDRAAVWRTLYLLEEDASFLAQAERDLRRAHEVAPSDPRVLAALGEALLMAQRPSDAFPYLQRALLADPSQAGARTMLAELAIRAGRTHLERASRAPQAKQKEELQQARDAAERAVALDAPSPDALVFLGDVLRAQGDWIEPLRRYESARERFPEAAGPRDAIAKLHMDRGHYYHLLFKKPAEAVAEYRQALAIEGTTLDLAPARERLHEIAVTAYGEAMEEDRAGRHAAAAEKFALSVAAEPTPEGHLARAIVLGRAERPEEALAAYDAALALRPDFLPARLNRASTLMRLGRLDAAEEDYRAWLASAPADDPSRRAAERQVAILEAERKALDGTPPR